MVLAREGLRQAQRPGLPIVNGVASATHVAAHIAGLGYGKGPTDAMEIGAHHEMKVNFDEWLDAGHPMNPGANNGLQFFRVNSR